MAEEKKESPQGPLVRALREQAPQIMAELMQSFIEARDLNSRARVRMQMKAMLDLFSTDTEYPPVPALNDEQRMAQQMGAVGAVMGHPQIRPNPLHYVPDAPALRDAVEEAVQPVAPEVAPAPGARVAGPGE